jgi:hypothetical protein
VSYDRDLLVRQKTTVVYDRDLLVRQKTTVVYDRDLLVRQKTTVVYDRDVSDWPSHRSKDPARNSADITSFRFPWQFLSST